jgi:hypothetical protein
MIEYSMLRIHTDSWIKFRKIAFERRTTITKLFNEVVANLETQQDCPRTVESDWDGAILKQGDVIIGKARVHDKGRDAA